jgi:hypothetical protein
MTNRTRRHVVAGLLATAAAPAWAQGDMMRQGKGLLEGVIGGGKEGGGKGGQLPAGLGQVEVGKGLKEALRVGAETVVGKLGRTDGFNLDPVAHIPLPKSLETVRQTLGKLGMSSMLDDLDLRLNRAAEAATGKVKPLFWQAIEKMTLDDVMQIYNGPDDAATRYFKRTMTPGLKTEMRPVINNAMAEVGAVQSYERTMSQYRQVPLVPDVKANLTDHVLQGALDGIFHYLGKEEAAIRNQPVKRTTALLQRVFGAKS